MISSRYTMTQAHLFCFGLGYSALALARRLLAQGWRVSGTCRTGARADALRRLGISAYRFDTGQAVQDAGAALAGVTHVLGSAPPLAAGDPALLVHASDLAAHGASLRWLGYLSTLGVYGDQQGRWIDETCPPQPVSEGGRHRLTAESQWLDLGRRLGVPVHVFRLPGIYGPDGRSQIDALRAGRAQRIVKAGQVFNRIHVDDLATVLLASMQQPHTPSPIYNVTDDEPAPSDQVVAYAAALLGMPAPPAVDVADAQLSPFAAHFYAECKRVRNHLIKQELGVSLRYPSYREGLAAVAGAGASA